MYFVILQYKLNWLAESIPNIRWQVFLYKTNCPRKRKRSKIRWIAGFAKNFNFFSEKKANTLHIKKNIRDAMLVSVHYTSRCTCSLFTWSKQKWLFWRAGLYLANRSNLKSFQKALIGWKKTGPPNKPLLFWSCKQANGYFNHGRLFIEALSSQSEAIKKLS